MAAPALQHKIRGVILTVAFTAVTVTGALYGAGLKTEKDVQKVVEKRREATPAEKIVVLEEHRAALVTKRTALERKIHEIKMRMNGATREQSMQGRERKRPGER